MVHSKSTEQSSVYKSVLMKCLLILTVATAVVAGVIAVTSDRAIRMVANDGLRQISIDLTDLLAKNISGAVRFQRIDVVKI